MGSEGGPASAERPEGKAKVTSQNGHPVTAVDCKAGSCARCVADSRFLTQKRRPKLPDAEGVLRVADLFAGCGGMSLGLFEAARRSGKRLDVTLAVDVDERSLETLKSNLPGAKTSCKDVAELFPGSPGSPLTPGQATL